MISMIKLSSSVNSTINESNNVPNVLNSSDYIKEILSTSSAEFQKKICGDMIKYQKC